jgi:predicted SAM-dependent methyltransferase
MKVNNQPLIRPSIWHYKKIRAVRASVVRQRRYQLTRRRVQTLHYLNVGCGPNIEKEFVNLDYDWYPGVDVCWDITKPLPWQDKSLKGIYSEHCLEHLPFVACNSALREFKRILKPGGSIRIVVPDGEMYLELYHENRAGRSALFPNQSPDEVTPMMCVNRIFRDYASVRLRRRNAPSAAGSGRVLRCQA